MTNGIRIRPAVTPAELEDVRALFREYERWLEYNLCFQGFEAELAALPGRYTPPGGRLYLADARGELAGCIALRAFAPDIAEMKRLFVREAARGAGAGRALAELVIADARAIGYRALWLDTLRTPKMAAANGLYEALGFRDIAPYYPNPLPEARYMGLDLRVGVPGTGSPGA
jgi:ribosomal protein S18 acetylase RimI-like enzyme